MNAHAVMSKIQVRRTVAIVAVVAIAAFAQGCAVPVASTAVHTAAVFPDRIENEIVLSDSFDECWARLIAGLSSQFFVINNVEKASGLITLDFSSNDAERFVDCGNTTRTYGDKTVTYKVAEDAEFQIDAKSGVNVIRQDIVRRTSVTGKINVHLSAAPDGTKVAVNVRYIWTNAVGGTYRVAGSLVTSAPQALTPETFTKSFNTGTQSEPESDDDIRCGSNGALEAMILDIVRNK